MSEWWMWAAVACAGLFWVWMTIQTVALWSEYAWGDRSDELARILQAAFLTPFTLFAWPLVWPTLVRLVHADGDSLAWFCKCGQCIHDGGNCEGW